MKYSLIALSVTAAAAAAAGFASADDQAPADGPGWTGMTNPADVVAARQALMNEIEALMQPIDTYTAGESVDAAALDDAAGTIETMLLAVPHLFPPTTNLYDPAAETPATLALPAIWQDFSTFYELSSAASTAAARLASSTESAADLRQAARGLRASCDACHALYLRPYVPAEVGSEDIEFDFDSVFPDD